MKQVPGALPHNSVPPTSTQETPGILTQLLEGGGGCSVTCPAH